MKINVNGREVKIKDDVANLYTKYAGVLNESVVKLFLVSDGIDIDKLSDLELEKQIHASIEKELREREYLSRPEVIKEAIDFAKSH